MPFMSPRVQRQFGSLFSPSDTLTDWSPQQEEPDSGRYFSDVRRMYGETPALDAYRQHLQRMPSREDYQPSGWERVAAGLSGFSAGLKDAGEGIRTAMGLNRSRYASALDEYYNTAKPLEAAADLERQGIDDQVGYLMKANELGLKYDDYQRQVQRDKTDAEIRRGELGVKEGQLGVNRDRLGWDREYGGKRLEQFSRDLNSLDDYRKGQVRIGERNAGTNAFNAQTNRQNATSLSDWRQNNTLQGWGRVGNESERIGIYKKDVEQRGQNQRLRSGSDMEAFQQDELSNLRADYPDLIGFDDQGALALKEAPDVGTPEYQDYQNLIRELERRINYRSKFGQVDFGLDDDGGDWELTGVGPSGGQ